MEAIEEKEESFVKVLKEFHFFKILLELKDQSEEGS